MPTLLDYAHEGRRIAKDVNDRLRFLPDGEYDTIIDEVELKTRKDGASQYFMITYRVDAGDYDNYKIIDILSLRSETVRSSIYKIEDLLHVLDIELDDSDYGTARSLENALRNALINRRVELRYNKMPQSIKIDILRSLDNDESSDSSESVIPDDIDSNESVDLSDIPF